MHPKNSIAQIVLWNLIDGMDISEKDYLLIFKLTASGKNQQITHLREQPPYERPYVFRTKTPITAKIYVIDDGDHIYTYGISFYKKGAAPAEVNVIIHDFGAIRTETASQLVGFDLGNTAQRLCAYCAAG